MPTWMGNALEALTPTAGSPTLSTSISGNGNAGVLQSSTNGALSQSELFGPFDEGVAVGYFRHDSSGFNYGVVMTLVSNTLVGVVRWSYTATNTGAFQYWNGSAWTNIGSTISVLQDETWRWEIEFTGLGTASANITCRAINPGGTPYERSVSAIDMTASANISRIRVGSGANSNAWGGRFLVTDEAATAGALVIRCDVPTADGTDNTDGTGSYLSVDNTSGSPDGDAISLTTATQKRSVKRSAAIDIGAASPLAAGFGVRARCGATGPQNLTAYLRVNGTRYDHPDAPVALSTSYAAFNFIWEINPDTGVAWTKSDVEDASLEWGWEAIT